MSIVTALWLTEEKLDKHRRRRSCLGCGETQEYSVKDPAPSFVAWWKAHQACRPAKSFDADMPQEPGVTSEPGVDQEAAALVDQEAAALPECRECGSVGHYLTENGLCGERDEAVRHDESMVKIEAIDADPRIQAFITRTGCTYEEVQQMIDKGQITLRGPQGELAKDASTPPCETHTREALLDRSPANPGHKSHAGAPIPVSEALMTKIAQGYSGQSIAEKSQVRKPFTYEGQLYAHTFPSFQKHGLTAYRLIPRGEWPGETLTYENLNPETGYHGIEVKQGKSSYVMTGPEVTFVKEDADNKDAASEGEQ